jgi:hypothetical protein
MADPKPVQLIIAAKDLAARVFDASKAKVTSWARDVRSTVSSAVSGINGVLATIGVGISLGALTALMKHAVDEGKEAETATNELAGAVGNLGLDFDKLAPKINATIDHLSALAARDDEEVSGALSNMITKTRDLDGSLRNLPLALDIAAKEHIELAAASDLVSKAMNGQDRVFKQLGITSGTHAEKMEEMRRRYAGFAEKEGLSFTGLQNRIVNGWNNILEAVGNTVIRNDDLRGSLQDLAEWLEGTSQNMTGLDKTMFVLTSTVQILWGVLKSVVLLGFAPLATAALGVATVIRGVFALFAAGGITVGEFINVTIRAANALERWQARVRGVEAHPLPELDLSGLARWGKAQVEQIEKNRDNIIGAWTQAGEAIGETAATVSLVNEKGAVIDAGGNPNAVVPRRTTKRTPPPAPGGDEKADAKAARALDQRIQLLAKAAQTEQGRASALAGLATIEAELTAKLERHNLTLQQEAKLRTQLRAVQEAQDDAREKEIDLLVAGAEVRDKNSDAITKLERRERQLVALVREGTDAAAKRTLAEQDLARVEAELAAARDRAAGIGGGLAPDPDEVARLTAREQELTDQTRSLGIVERDGAKFAAELAAVRKRLSEATSAFDGASLTRLTELEAEMATQLEREQAALPAGNGERRRQIDLERALARVRAEIDQRTGRQLERPKVGEGNATVVQDGERVAGPAAPAERITIEPGQLPSPKLPAPDISWVDRLIAKYREASGMADDVATSTRSIGTAMAEVAGTALGALQDAAAEAFAHIGRGTKEMGKAFAGAIKAGVAGAAREESRYWFQKGIAALGHGILGDPRGFLSAGYFFAAAAGFGAIAGAASGGSRSGGGGAGSGSSARSEALPSTRGEAERVVYLSMPAGDILFNGKNADQVEAFRRFFEELANAKVIVLPQRGA